MIHEESHFISGWIRPHYMLLHEQADAQKRLEFMVQMSGMEKSNKPSCGDTAWRSRELNGDALCYHSYFVNHVLVGYIDAGGKKRPISSKPQWAPQRFG